ncbi:MAG: tryptophan--tRNA ligase [Deltaproteobacteria bacterium]|nr:tryptophan--tRNA ligase [Deltaproteobacteria bacterium]
MLDADQKIVVSGMRPTGLLHLGNYHGALENWVRLQADQTIARRFFFVADWHSLTTDYDQTSEVKNFGFQMFIDWLAFGLDPAQSTIFIQSRVPEHAELHLLLSMITPVAWLERVPTYKDLQKELSGKDLSTYGFLGYPLLQTADVALYSGSHVPVGQDQVAHIELSREIVRKFNHHFKHEVLAEPQALLTKFPKIPGTDGRKMSKSYNNSIYLSDTTETVRKKILPMKTDPARMRRTDAGDPEKCPVFDYHKIYSSPDTINTVAEGCRSAGMGCIDCKKALLKSMDERLDPFRQRRVEVAAKPDDVRAVIEQGNTDARKVAVLNMERVREVIKI